MLIQQHQSGKCLHDHKMTQCQNTNKNLGTKSTEIGLTNVQMQKLSTVYQTWPKWVSDYDVITWNYEVKIAVVV